jgi:hypothetical protein
METFESIHTMMSTRYEPEDWELEVKYLRYEFNTAFLSTDLLLSRRLEVNGGTDETI